MSEQGSSRGVQRRVGNRSISTGVLARIVSVLLLAAGLLLAPSSLADPPPEGTPQSVPLPLDRIFATANENIDIDGVDDKRVDVDVAVLDTGAKLNYPDLNIVERTNCAQATQANGYACTNALPSDGEDLDPAMHGTGSAFRIGAIDNGFGEVGVVPGARIWVVGVHGPPDGPDVGTVIAGVKWVTAHADEIEIAHLAMNCTLEPLPALPIEVRDCGPEPAEVEKQIEELESAIAESVAKGVVYVVPAGNNNNDVSQTVPQMFDEPFVVSGMGDSDGKPGGLGGPACPFWQTPDDAGWYDPETNTGGSWGAGVDLAAPGCATSGTSTLVTGAAAMLASVDNPENAADVVAIGETIFGDSDCKTTPPDTGPNVGAANCNWTDNNAPEAAAYGQQIKEPLLDVSDEEVFDPKTLPGCEATEAPEVDSDVDGDGHADLVTMHPDGSVTVHGGGEGEAGLQFASGVDSFSGEGVLTPALFIGAGDHVVDVADVTADGCADLVAVTSEGDATVYPGRPDRSFGFPIPSLEGTLEPALLKAGGDEPIAAADVSGDGRADLVSYDDESDYLTVYPGSADGSFGSGVTTSKTVYSALHTASGEYLLDAADVTGDGRSDLVSMTTWDDIWVRPGQSNGSFGDPIGTNYGTGVTIDPALNDGSGREPVGLGDVTGDGKADLVLTQSATVYVYPAQGGANLGRFGSAKASGGITPSTTFGASPGFEFPGVFDLDANGRADIVLAHTGGRVYVAGGQEDGSFKTPASVSFEEGFLKSTQHFKNQNASGSELVIEKPALRRRGCASNGCHHTTASLALASGFGATGRGGGYSIYPGEADGDVLQRGWTSELGWSGWGWHGSPPGGQATSASAATSTQGADHVFVRGAAGALWQKSWSDEAGKWSEWASLGGELATGPGPAAVAPETTKIDVFARSASNQSVIRKSWTSGSGWGSWETVAGTKGATGVGASSRNGLIDLFMRDAEGDVTQRWWTSGTGWSEQGGHGSPPGGPTSSAPAAVALSGSVHVFVRGADRAIWEKVWTDASGKWSEWTSLGGVLRSGPSVTSPASGEIHLFARAANDSYWRKRWSEEEGWSGWEPVF